MPDDPRSPLLTPGARHDVVTAVLYYDRGAISERELRATALASGIPQIEPVDWFRPDPEPGSPGYGPLTLPPLPDFRNEA